MEDAADFHIALFLLSPFLPAYNLLVLLLIQILFKLMLNDGTENLASFHPGTLVSVSLKTP